MHSAVMHPAAVQPSVPRPVTELRSATFRGRRDLILLSGLVVAAVALLLVDLPVGERIIPLTAVAAIAIGWGRSLRETWGIGNDWVSHRRWYGTRYLPIDQLVSVDIVHDSNGVVDAVGFATAESTLTVPLHELRDHAEFSRKLHELISHAAELAVPGSGEALQLV